MIETIRGLDAEQMKTLRGLVSMAQEHFADASGVLAGSPEAATWNRARKNLLDGTRWLAQARAMLEAALEPQD